MIAPQYPAGSFEAEEHYHDEGRWGELEDSRTGDVRAPLALLEGLHASWVQLLRCITWLREQHGW